MKTNESATSLQDWCLDLQNLQPNLTKVGFLHFGQGHTEPIPVLANSLRDAQKRYGEDVTDGALVVLPEAFNIRKPYYDEALPNVDPTVLTDLMRISSDFHCAFVAGLIIQDSRGVDPPYSSAYLIDGSAVPRLLCRKSGRDDTEISRAMNQPWKANYTAFPEQPGAGSKPILYRGIAVAAVICMDAHYEEATDLTYPRFTERSGSIAQELRSFGSRYQVVCVPACMSNGFGGGQPGINVTEGTPWQGTIQVLANRHSGHVNSFVSAAHGVILEPTGRREENRVEIKALENCSVTKL